MLSNADLQMFKKEFSSLAFYEFQSPQLIFDLKFLRLIIKA